MSPELSEDLTARFAEKFIEYAINYAQEEGSRISFRHEKLAYQFKPNSQVDVRAIDDGRIENEINDKKFQVAVLECKRKISYFTESGKPSISDKVLAQRVGQALAQRRHESKVLLSQDNSITIHAASHFIRFFHFQTTASYMDT
ncbi:hypothetical protein HIM_10193 [Hirsutella minnesotensis 3608]|uniref:Restriction endonuclease type IV Mrr domain-containing protein n=1 Tax=Hirsutella minnesotensis 3608 TaxID=1043627 RepID=A0A0F7ZKC6_9HYPO|nr:hypothetical protein HIM_10193 [Hirsutella minnesotensis 3608]